MIHPLRVPKDPPMEGWMNLYDAGVFLGPQKVAIFEGEIVFLGWIQHDSTHMFESLPLPPMVSMGLVYLPTWMVDFLWFSCR